MKKLAILVFIFLIIISGSVSLAEENTTIIDSQVPGSPVEDVNSLMYGEPQTEILDEEIPLAPLENDVKDEEIPKGSALPKTGGIPAELFYVAGALIVVAALILSKKKAKVSTKN